MRTRAGDFTLRCGTSIDDQTSVTITHNDPGTATVDWIGSEYTVTSGSPAGFYWPQDHDGLATVRFSNFTAYATELEIDGMIGLEIGQLPPQLTRFEHSGSYFTYDGLTMSGTSLPSGLVDLHVENIRSSADVDRIITALEVNGASSGNLFLAEQTLSKATDLLESRSWDVEVEPQFAHKIERSKAPHTSVIDGKAVHHVDRRRGGGRRKQWEGRCIEFNGTSEHATLSSFTTPTGDITVAFGYKDTAIPPNLGGIFGKWQASGNQRSFLVAIDDTTGYLFAYQSVDGSSNASRSVEMNFADGVWRHIAVVFSASTGFPTIYVDGDPAVMAGSSSVVGNMLDSSAPLEMGRFNESYASSSSCFIDDVYLFSGALPASEIAARAAMSPQDPPPSLSSVPLIWLPMDDATSSPIIRNHGSLGQSGDFILTGTPSSIWTTSDRYSYPNEHSCSSGLVTNGVDSYIDTGVTLDGAMAFTVLREARYLSTNAYDMDGFRNSGGSAIRIGRDTGGTDIYLQAPTSAAPGAIGVGPLPDGEFFTQSLTATSGGNTVIQNDGVQVYSASSGAFTISNALNYLIGSSEEGTGQNHPSHAEYTRYLIASRVLTDDEITYWRTRGASGTAFDSATDADILVDYDFQAPHPRIVHNAADPGNPGKIVGDCEWVAINHDAATPTQDMNGKALTWTGPVPRDSVVSSPAALGNGSSAYVSIPNVSIADIQDVSLDIEFLVRDSDKTNALTVLGFGDSSDNNSYFRIIKATSSSGKLRLLVKASNGSTVADFEGNAVVFDGEWHKVRVTYDGTSDLAIYVDDALDATGTLTKNGTTDINTLTFLGWHRSGGVVGWSPSEIAGVDISVDGATLGTWPTCEPSGDIVWDVSGQGRHGDAVSISRVATQNASDVLIGSGFAKGTWFDGSSDSYSRANLVGPATRFCISCSIHPTSLPGTSTVAAEYKSVGNQKSWFINVASDGSLSFGVSDDGASGPTSVATSAGAIAVGETKQLQITYDAGSIIIELDGAVAAAGSIADVSIFGGSALFMIGAAESGSKWTGTLSQLLIHKDPTAVWSASTKAAIRAEGTTEEVKAIVDNLGGTAWYFQDGNGTESLQGIADLTENGAPEERIIPAGAGVPVSYGPGVPAPGQSRLVASEPNSPFALRYAQDYTLESGDLVYEAVYGSGSSYANLNGIKIGATDDFDLSIDFMLTSTEGGDESQCLFAQYAPASSGRLTFVINHSLTNPRVGLFVDHSTTDVLIYGPEDIVLNRWHTARATRVGDVFTLYFDGVQSATQTQSGISVYQTSSILGSSYSTLDEFTGRIRNVRIDNNGTVTELLTEGIGLPGATLTNVTLSSKPAGAIGGRILFQNSDDTANLYEEPMSAEMADIIGRRKYS